MNHILEPDARGQVTTRLGSCSWTCALALIVLFSFSLRMISLGAEALGGDELFSHRVISLPIPHAMEMILWDIVHPPLYYLMLKAWSGVFGADAMGMRSLSICWGAITVGLTAIVGRALLREKWSPLLASLLVGLSAPQIFYSQQTRSYAMFAAVMLLMILACWSALQTDRVAAWIVFGSVAAVLVYTHYIGWLYLLGTLPAVVIGGSRRQIVRWTIAASGVGLVFALWAISVAPYLRAKDGFESNLNWVGVPAIHSLFQVFADFNGLPDIARGTTLTLAVAALLLTPVAHRLANHLFGDRTEETRTIATAVTLLGGAALLTPVMLFALTRPPFELTIWGARHLLPSQAPLALLSAFGLAAVARARVRGLAPVGVIALLALQAFPNLRHLQGEPRRTPTTAVARYLSGQVEPGQRLFTTSWYNLGASINYYLPNSGMSPDSLSQLPLDAGMLPSDFWIVFRPAVQREQSSVSLVMERGWRSVREEYFGRHAGDEWGLRVLLLSRRPTLSPARPSP